MKVLDFFLLKMSPKALYTEHIRTNTYIFFLQKTPVFHTIYVVCRVFFTVQLILVC